jgi:hypothetical protein
MNNPSQNIDYLNCIYLKRILQHKRCGKRGTGEKGGKAQKQGSDEAMK